MQRRQADARQEALGRHMRELAPRDGEQFAFIVIGRRQRHVTALARQRDPAARGLDHAADAQPGAGPDHRQRAARRRQRGPRDRGHLVRPQAGQRQRQRLEVVQQPQLVQAEVGLQLAAGEGPVAVGQLDAVALDRGRQRQRGPPGPRLHAQAGEFLQIGLGRRAQRFILSDRQLAHMLDRLAGAVDPREAGIAAADVRHQPRIPRGARRRHTLICLHCACPACSAC